MTEPSRAVFLSYASQDAKAAQRVCEALRTAGIEVWFDQSELRGGDAWDATIRKQIKACALFIPLISANAHERKEGYFRLEWKLAVDRSHLMSPDQAFLLPVVVDDTPWSDERIPERFSELTWTRLPGGQVPPAFVERVLRLLAPDEAQSHATLQSGAELAPSVRKAPSAWRHRRALWLVVPTAAVLAGFAAYKLWSPRHPSTQEARNSDAGSASPTIPEKSIAVLPFLDLSEKKDQEYLSDGLSEELIDMLTKVPELRVPARTSSFYFKGKQSTLADMAKALSVRHVLEGSVQKSGDRLRITAKLIRVDGGYNVWSQTYDRRLDDIFRIEDEISSGVVTALKASLLADETPSRPVARRADAYAQLLQGRYLYLRQAVGDNQAAADSFQQAIRLDPAYAGAWAGLSKALSNLGDDWHAQREQALSAAERALALDPRLAEAHIAMGKIRLYLDFDLAAADREFRQARALEPGDVSVLLWAAYFADTLGHVNDARALYQQCLAIDPLNPRALWNLAWDYFATGHPAEAEPLFRKFGVLTPTSPGAHAFTGLTLVSKGQADAGIAEIEREQDPESRDQCLTWAYLILGRRREADAALARFESSYAARDPYEIAGFRALRGDLDQAFAWLDRAFQQRDRAVIAVLVVDPRWKDARGDQRYKTFLRKLQFPE